MAVKFTFTPIKADGTSDTSHRVEITGDALPTTADIQDNTTSISYNTVLGDFVDFPIALKRKLILKWDILSDTQIDALYYDGLLLAEKTNKRRFYRISITGDSELNKKMEALSTDSIYYLGTPVEWSRIAENGSTTYYSGELHFIQVIAYSLNNPVQQSNS